jgi:hypothetical protein
MYNEAATLDSRSIRDAPDTKILLGESPGDNGKSHINYSQELSLCPYI